MSAHHNVSEERPHFYDKHDLAWGRHEIRPERHVAVYFKEGVPQSTNSSTLLFFVHGSCAHMAQWESQIEEFGERGYSVLAMDALGCGQSARPRSHEAYSSENLFQDTQTVLRRFSDERDFTRVVVLGHSYGTVLALALAQLKHSEEPDPTFPHIDALVLMGATATFQQDPATIMRLPEVVLGCLRPMLGRMFRSKALHPLTFTEKPELVHQEILQSARNPVYMFRSFYLQLLEWCAPRMAQHRVGRIPIPVLLVSGAADAITPVHGAALLHSWLPAGELQVVEQASHQVMQEQPAEVNQLLAAFLERHF